MACNHRAREKIKEETFKYTLVEILNFLQVFGGQLSDFGPEQVTDYQDAYLHRYLSQLSWEYAHQLLPTELFSALVLIDIHSHLLNTVVLHSLHAFATDHQPWWTLSAQADDDHRDAFDKTQTCCTDSHYFFSEKYHHSSRVAKIYRAAPSTH